LKLSWIVAISSCALTLVPVVIGTSRDSVLSSMTNRSGISVLAPSSVSEKTCNEEFCRVDTHFHLDPIALSKLRSPSVGYYGAFADSWIRLGSRDIDSIEKREDVRLSWFQFRTIPIGAHQDIQGDVSVVSVSPHQARRIGLTSPRLFLGETRQLDSLKRAFEFFNVHLYILGALLTLGAAVMLFASRQANRAIDLTRLLSLTGLVCAAQFTYSHYFDDILQSVGVPLSLIEGQARLFWGPVVLVALLNSKRTLFTCVSLYLALVAPGLIDWPGRDIFFAGVYRSVVAATTVIAAVETIRRKKYRFLPFILVATYDVGLLFGLVPMFGGIYLSPLTFPALPLLRYLDHFMVLARQHVLWYRRTGITQEMKALRESHDTSFENWNRTLGKLVLTVATSTGANRVSICYLGLDSPLIVSYSSKRLKEYKDGRLPPVFARVVQTKEALWWVHKDDLSQLNTKQPKRNETYTSDHAVVLPIICAGEVYGAISLTDFSDLGQILADPVQRQYTEEVIAGFVDLISSHLVRQRESSSVEIERTSNRLTEDFSHASSSVSGREQLVSAFLTAACKALGVRGMFFSFDSDSRALAMISAHGEFHNDAVNLWKSIPFKARADNKISPFAIATNERKPIFIDDIQVFYNLLFQQSIDAVEATKTKGFLVHPVVLGETTFGLLVLVDSNSGAPVRREMLSILDQPVRYLAFQLEQVRNETVIREQEKVISHFADPRLVELLKGADASAGMAIGDVFEGVLILQDLRGSTAASKKQPDPKELARRLAKVYQTASDIAKNYGAAFDKGNGDGLITTMNAPSLDNRGALLLCLEYLLTVYKTAADQLGVSDTIVIAHRGIVFRGILGNTSRVAWDTCGRDLVDAFSIEKVAKKLDGVVFALSAEFLDGEQHPLGEFVSSLQPVGFAVDGLDRQVIGLSRAQVEVLRQQIGASKRAA